MANEIEVIVGPTSSGKTSLALELCKKEGGAVVSADSRQIYKDMNIGTGKVPIDKNAEIVRGEHKWNVDGIDIWGYDLTQPDMYFSVFDYAEFAIKKLNELKEDSNVNKLFLVGGTGFYIDAVIGRTKLEGVQPDFKLRKELESMPITELYTKLTSLNLGMSKKIDKHNKVRLVRAIEKEINANKPARALPKLNFSKIKLTGLTAERPLLYQKADFWLETIWHNGLLDETKVLMQKYPTSEKLKGLIYVNAVDFIQEREQEHTAIQKAKYALHAYIRRQQTWFKKNPEIEWWDISNEILL